MLSAIRQFRPRSPKRSLLLAATCALAAMAMPASVLGEPSSGDADTSAEQTHRYIVVLKEDEVAHPGRVAQRHAINRDAELTHVYKHAIEGYAATMTMSDKETVERDPNVAFVERATRGEAASQETATGLERIFAPGNSTLDIDGVDDVQVNVDVAIIDSGIDYDHPDLRVVERTNCRTSKGEAPHICVDDAGDDGLGHGTHVAGIVGAIDNDFGVVGVAPGARLWSVKVISNDDDLWDDEVLAGIDWVTDHAGQIEVANMSLEAGSGCSTSGAIGKAIKASVDAGVAYVVAAGNEGYDAAGVPEVPALHPISPACLEDPITVSSVSDYDGLPGSLAELPAYAGCSPNTNYPFNDEDDTLAESSNWGKGIDIAAPGACILSTYKHGGYRTMGGTSMAAPHVAGAMAILASEENPSSRGDVMDLRKELLDNGNYDWTDDGTVLHAATGKTYGPDGVKEPLLDISNETVFNVSSPGTVGSVGVVSHVAGSIDLFARNGNNEIWRKVYHPAPTQWGNWYTDPNPSNSNGPIPIAGAPAIASRSSLGRDLFVKGNDGALYFRNFYNGTWSSWFWIPGPNNDEILSSPAAVHREDVTNGLTVVVRAKNGGIYLKDWFPATEWSTWHNLEAPPTGVASSPAIAMHDGKYLHVTVRGGDGAIWDKAYSHSTGWSSWVSLGAPSGGVSSSPALTSTESGDDIYLFALGADSAMWMRKGSSGWSPWESLGGKWVSDPAATSMSSAGVSVFASGLDNKLQERRYLYGGWTNWMRIDDDCPPEACSWEPGGPGTGHTQSVESNDLVTVDSEGTANVYPGYSEGFDIEDPVHSLEGDLDSALLDGKGHYLIDVADVNDDDNSDLVTVKDEGKVLIHLGNGDRTFEAATDTGISLPPIMNGAGHNEPIAVADVTGEGFDDLIVFTGPGSGKVSLYKGKLDGSFETTPIQSSWTVDSGLVDGNGYYFLDAADVDGDGRADLLGQNTGGSLVLYKGQEDGKFASGLSSSASANPIMDDGEGHEPLGFADVDGDGYADLLTLDPEGELQLFKGQESLKFASPTSPYEGTIDSSLIDGEGEELLGLLDFDADGRSDLISVTDEGELRTYRSQSGGSFAEPIAQADSIETIRHQGTHEVALERPALRRTRCPSDGCVVPSLPPTDSDVDGDHRADLAVLDSEGTLRNFAGTTAGIPASAGTVALPEGMDSALRDRSGHYAVDLSDVDGDIRSDLTTVRDDGRVFVYPGQSDRSFGEALDTGIDIPPAMNEAGSNEPIAVADLTGDRRGDLIVFVGSTPTHLAVYAGQASGKFATTPTTSLSGSLGSALMTKSGHYFLDAADVTGDGLADLVSVNGKATVFKGQSDGTFAAGVTHESDTFNPIMDDGTGLEPIGLGDIDFDRRADLLAIDESGYLKAYLGKADGKFPLPVYAYLQPIDSSLLDGSGEELVGLLDYNRDGGADLVSVDPEEGKVRVYKANTNGLFASPALQPGSLPYRPELLSEKPLLRRALCTAGGCEMPGNIPHDDYDPANWVAASFGGSGGVWESYECWSEYLEYEGNPCTVEAKAESWQLRYKGTPISSCKLTQSWDLFFEQMQIAESSFGTGCGMGPAATPPNGVMCARIDPETGYPEEFWLRQESPVTFKGRSYGKFEGTTNGSPESPLEATELDFDNAQLSVLVQDGTFALQSPVWLHGGSDPCSWPELG